MTITCVSGDPVSVETQNGLLELLAYYGVGNHVRDGRVGGVKEGGVEVGGVKEGGVMVEGVKEGGVEEGGVGEGGVEVGGVGEGGVEVGGVEELGEKLGESAGEEAAAYLAGEREEREERSLKDRAHLMQFHVSDLSF